MASRRRSRRRSPLCSSSRFNMAALRGRFIIAGMTTSVTHITHIAHAKKHWVHFAVLLNQQQAAPLKCQPPEPFTGGRALRRCALFRESCVFKLAAKSRIALAMVLGAGVLAACGEGEQQAPPPPEVKIYTVKTVEVPRVVELPGRVQAIRTAEVRA